MDLNDQLALLTSGIGLLTARVLADDVAQVVVTGRGTEMGKAAMTSLGGTRSVRFVQADLAHLDSLDRFIDQIGPVNAVARASAPGGTSQAHKIAEVIAFIASPRASYGRAGATVRADAGGSTFITPITNDCKEIR
jgi:NAD(P)-dependent dehydrogenase (short-subunit alcohol dehydrogenase family)